MDILSAKMRRHQTHLKILEHQLVDRRSSALLKETEVEQLRHILLQKDAELDFLRAQLEDLVSIGAYSVAFRILIPSL